MKKEKSKEDITIIDTTLTERKLKIQKKYMALKGVAITELLIIVVLVAYNFILFMQPKKEIGYVVEINQLTGVQNVRNLEGAVLELEKFTMPEYLMMNSVKTYITNLRSVSTDVYQSRANIQNVYAYSTENAIRQSTDYFRENNPIDRYQKNKERVVVYIYNSTVADIQPKKGETKFQVDWTETTYSEYGEIKKQENYRAIIDTKQFKATKSTSQVNPLGFYITNFFISEIKDGFLQK